MGLPLLGMGLIMMVIYYWSRKNPNVVVSFMFGLKFQVPSDVVFFATPIDFVYYFDSCVFCSRISVLPKRF